MRLLAFLIMTSCGICVDCAFAAEPPKRCSLEFKSETPRELLKKIERDLAKIGAHAGQIGDGSKDDALLGMVHTFVQSFDLPVRGAERIAKSLASIAPVDYYSCAAESATDRSQQLESLNGSIKALEGESKANAKALARMPVSRALLKQNLNSLYGARKSIQLASRSIIIVTVLDVH